MGFMDDNSLIPFLMSCLLSVVIFLTLITYISKHPKKNTKVLKVLFVVMFILGMLVYCYCHYRALEDVVNGATEDKSLDWTKNENGSFLYRVLYVAMRSVVDVGMMFYGRGNSSVFYNLQEAEDPRFVFGFWLLHTIAFFTASSALLIRFGEDFLTWVRRLKTKVLDVDLIFGVNSDSISFGRKIADNKGSMLVYVDNSVNESYESSIKRLGGVTYSDTAALEATLNFLGDIRIKKNKTKLRLYTLSKEYDKNLQYARIMSENLKALNINPEQTKLVLLGIDEEKGMIFQSSENQYGYGSVFSFDEYEMNARILMHDYPLCNAINFDKSGRATEDMEVLIVGFGHIGHEVLRKVIANGQFEGSSFHATIYELNFMHRTDFYQSQYPSMLANENYNIDFELQDIRGYKFFNFLRANASKLKYIVICLEDSEIARDIAIRAVDCLQFMGYSQNVYTCDSKSVRCYSTDFQKCKTHWIYDSELLYSDELDKYAMELNHRYCVLYGGTKSLEEDWKECRYFDRMSSRASVDYLIPLISKLKAMMNTDTLNHEQLENLAKSEHLRWCAFHYTFGYDVMEKEEFIKRIKDHIKKPGKDTEKKKHICLVKWDELDEISQIENSLTQANRDYKKNDRENVDMIIELMQDEKQLMTNSQLDR